MPNPLGIKFISYDLSDVTSYPGTGNTLYDLTVNENNLGLFNGVSFGGTGQSKYIEFDGVNDYASTPSGFTGMTYNNSCTRFMWVWLDNVNTDQWWSSLGSYKSPEYTVIEDFYDGTTGNQWEPNFGANGNQINAGPLNPGRWINIAYTWDSSVAKAYVNGFQVGSTSGIAGSIDTSSLGFAVSGYIDNGTFTFFYPFDGRIAMLDYFVGTATSSEVLTYYNNTAQRFNLGLISEYDFSDPLCYSGSGTTVYDLNNNNDLLISGATFTSSGSSSYFNFNGSQYLYDTTFPSMGSTFSFNIWCKPQVGTFDDVIITGGANVASGFAPAISISWYAGSTYSEPFVHFNYGVGYTSGVAYVPNEWQMYTMTADGTTVKLYQDAVLTAQTSQSGGEWRTSPSGLVLGASIDSGGGPSNTEHFVGDIAIAQVYSSALASTSVTEIFNNTSSRFPSPPAPSYQAILGGRMFAQGFNG